MHTMTPQSDGRPEESDWRLLVGLQQRALRSSDRAELGFVIANESWQMAPYSQATVFQLDRLGRLSLTTASGLASIQEETPFTLWLGRICRIVSADFSDGKPRRISPVMLSQESGGDLREAWQEWWPEHALFVPITSQQGRRLGAAFFVRDLPWTDRELDRFELLAETWGHKLHSLMGNSPPILERLHKLVAHPRRKQILAVLGAITLFPVRLSALAPAEIIPLQAEVIAAPSDGVIKQFHVPPNASVKQGQILFSFDDTTLRNRREVAEKALAVARADALTTQQKAFDSLQSKSETSTLIGKVKEREAEFLWLEESLRRISVAAPLDGVLVYSDPNDWLGKPVVTGERVALLAQPDDLGVLVWLPVGDAINLEAGASMRVYLQVSPLSSLSAELIQTSYQASLSPDGVSSYKIRGRLAPGSEARIGLRGTAKVYGAWRPLIYWIFRRPLGSARQWLGI